MAQTLRQETVLDHYRKQAEEHGLQSTSTMADQVTREMETEVALACLTYLSDHHSAVSDLLEIGCGNGYLLDKIRGRFPDLKLNGFDFSPDMVELANRRNIDSCRVYQGDVKSFDFEDSTFDVIISQRCLINLTDRDGQEKSLQEIHRVLRPGGCVILIEAFMDGLENLNRARTELGLLENTVPHHNLWFDKDHFLAVARSLFDVLDPSEIGNLELPPTNFLSTHYFISRVLYPSITKREVLYNTEFVKFFRLLPPNGNYSPIQLFLLRKSA